MKHVITCAVLLLPMLLLSAAKADENDKDAKSDLKLLQGNWNEVAFETEGKKTPAKAFMKSRWTFKGSELQIIDPGGKQNNKALFKLDSSKSPKHFDLVVSD